MTAKECLLHTFILTTPEDIAMLIDNMTDMEVEKLIMMISERKDIEDYMRRCVSLSKIKQKPILN